MRGRAAFSGLERPTWADYLLGLFFLLLAAFCLFWSAGRIGGQGVQAEIISDGRSLGFFPLDVTEEILVEQGGYSNTLCLGQGQVFVRSADCPDQYCVRHAPIRREGESIVCLPARLVIRIQRGEEAAWDAISK